MNGDDLPVVLRVGEVARLLGGGRGLVYESIRQGQLPAIRIGRRILIPRDRLLAHLDGTASSDLDRTQRLRIEATATALPSLEQGLTE
jgi:excisionase family DNA binding protein